MPATKACCQPDLHSSTEQEANVFCQSQCGTAHLYEEQISTGVFAETQPCCQLDLHNGTEQEAIVFCQGLHEDHPENQNVRLTEEDDVLEVKRKGQWIKEDGDVAIYDVISRNCLRFIDVSDTLEKGMQKAKHDALTEYLELAEDMANKKNKELHADRYEFAKLLSQAKAAFCNDAV